MSDRESGYGISPYPAIRYSNPSLPPVVATSSVRRGYNQDGGVLQLNLKLLRLLE